jgi:hypothetical protein
MSLSSSSERGCAGCSGPTAVDGYFFAARPTDLRWLKRSGVLHELELGFDPADGTDRKRAADRLMRLHNECGCTAASAAFILAAMAIGLTRWIGVSEMRWWTLAGAALGASVVAKLLVLSVASYRLSRLVSRYAGV